jgi:hypothetical protein
MKIRAGFQIGYQCERDTAMLLVLNIHPSRRPDLLTEQVLSFDRPIEARDYIDGFGNACSRITAPAGLTTISTAFEIYDNGQPDLLPEGAFQQDIKDLPNDVLVFLLGMHCDTDRPPISPGRPFPTRRSASRGCTSSPSSTTTLGSTT